MLNGESGLFFTLMDYHLFDDIKTQSYTVYFLLRMIYTGDQGNSEYTPIIIRRLERLTYTGCFWKKTPRIDGYPLEVWSSDKCIRGDAYHVEEPHDLRFHFDRHWFRSYTIHPSNWRFSVMWVLPPDGRCLGITMCLCPNQTTKEWRPGTP